MIRLKLNFHDKIAVAMIACLFCVLKGFSQEAAVLEQIAGSKLRQNALQVKELAESILQYEQIFEQSETLKEMKEMYETVSDGVKKFSPVRNSFYYMSASYTLYKEIVDIMSEKIRKSYSPSMTRDQFKTIDQIMIAIIEDNADNIKDLKKVLSSGEMKMNDAERMELSKLIEKRSAGNYERLLTIRSIIGRRVLLF
jgi:hypothetical protein